MLSNRFLWAIASGAALTLQPVLVGAQQLIEPEEIFVEQLQRLPLEPLAQVTYDAYILGPGDSIQIEVLDLPELSGQFTIGPDGIIYLPRLRGLHIEGLTIEELRFFLTEQFQLFVIKPEVYITPTSYRPVRVYVGGEVARPGFYTISSIQDTQDALSKSQTGQIEVRNSGAIRANPLSINSETYNRIQRMTAPTLFDALQAARGVTPFSQLEKVQITRKRPKSQGGGKMRTSLNFLSLISEGNEEVNIRLHDGDAIFVNKSVDVLRDQLLAASRTNLSPDFVEVFVSGRVKEPGPQQLPQGASLNQAIASAGGPKLLRGKVEFLRFNNEGATDRRIFNYSPNSSSGDYRNPVLMPGDVVRVNESIASASLEFLNEITAPAVGLYSVYSIYQDFDQ